MNGFYRVIWGRRPGEIQLVRIVTDAFARGESTTAITDSVARIDELLSRRPNEVGESRPDLERGIDRATARRPLRGP